MTSNEVAAATGVSLRQLQWWDSCMVVSAHRASGKRGTGHYREWSKDDIRRLRLLMQIKRQVRVRGDGLRDLLKIAFSANSDFLVIGTRECKQTNYSHLIETVLTFDGPVSVIDLRSPK